MIRTANDHEKEYICMRSKKAALWQKLTKKATLQKKDNKTKE